MTGTIRGWEGEELGSLGEILHMGAVIVGPENKDRYFVLFSSNLLILSVSARMSGFIYEVVLLKHKRLAYVFESSFVLGKVAPVRNRGQQTLSLIHI